MTHKEKGYVHERLRELLTRRRFFSLLPDEWLAEVRVLQSLLTIPLSKEEEVNL